MAQGAGGRAARGTLTRELILDEALRLVDEEGLDALSFRTLGKRLGVSQTAFYRHVPDKASLLDGIAETVWREAIGQAGSIAGSDGASPDGWRAVFERYALRLRATLLAHPNAVLLMLTHPIATPGQFALAASAAAELEACGYAIRPDTLDLVTAVTVYTTGFAAAEVAPPAGGAGAEASREAAREAVDAADPGRRDALGRLLAPLTDAAGGWSMEGQFLAGLRALLRGWER